MEVLLKNPWYLGMLLVAPAIILGLAKSLKRFNEKIAEKQSNKKQTEAES